MATKGLQVNASVTAGATSAYVEWLTPGQGAFTATKSDEFAIEYDLFMPPTTVNRGWSAVAFTGHNEMGSSFVGPMIDQEGRTRGTVSDVDALFLRAAGRWYRRVIPVGKSGGPSATSINAYRVGVWITHPTGTPLYGNLSFSIANIRLTNFRETKLWMWREGMAAPTVSGGANTTGVSIAVADVSAPAVPSFCANAKITPLDDISHQRRTGGRLNSWLFWDAPRDSFRLTNILLDEQEAWDLMTFYSMFRREAVVYRHRANLPAMWCRFERPPEFEEVVYAGKVRYMTSLTMLQR